MDVFAPGFPKNSTFVVQNVSSQVKTISIFQYPINYQQTRDILKIPGVGPDDIKSSLLKGELCHKILAKDIIIVASDIDLLQFNDQQRAFLRNAGVVNGLQITSDQFAVIDQQDIRLIGTVDGTNTIFTAPAGNWIQSSPYKIIVYKNGVKQVMGDDYFISESGGPGTGYNTIIFTIPPQSLDTLTADYYTYNNL